MLHDCNILPGSETEQLMAQAILRRQANLGVVEVEGSSLGV